MTKLGSRNLITLLVILEIRFFDLEFRDLLIMSSSFEHGLEVVCLHHQLTTAKMVDRGDLPLDFRPNSRLFHSFLLGRFVLLDGHIFAYPEGYHMIPHG